MDERNHFPRRGVRGLLLRYGVSISVAVALALLAAAGGSWGTAFGQTAPPAGIQVAAASPTAVPTVAPTAVPTPEGGVEGAAPTVPNGLPNTGEPSNGSGTAVLLLTVAGVALLTGAHLVRRRAR